MKRWDRQLCFGLMFIIVAGAVMSVAADVQDYKKTPILSAHLSSVQNVKADENGARGKAAFYLSGNEKELHFRLDVSGIRDVTAAHIHLVANDGNGRVVATMFDITEIPPRGSCSDSAAEGSIKDKDLVGPLVGSPLAALLREMEGGHTYVIVHTKKYPMGHLRGQIADPSSF